jgi:malate/lactate dehydrogenase
MLNAPLVNARGLLCGVNDVAAAQVAIVGTGLVGATTAYALLLSSFPAQIVLINRNKALTQAHVDGLLQCRRHCDQGKGKVRRRGNDRS